MFVTDVANARKLDVKDEKIFADGRVFIASKAKEAGLIDSVGSLDIAKKKVIELSGVENPVWNRKSRLDTFFEKMATETQTFISKSLYSVLSHLE